MLVGFPKPCAAAMFIFLDQLGDASVLFGKAKVGARLVQHQLPQPEKPEHHHRREQHRQHVERSEEHTSELQSLMRISYAVFCLKKKNTILIFHLISIQLDNYDHIYII